MLSVLGLLLAGPAEAAPQTLPVQGVLRDNAGNLVSQGRFRMTFSLYAGKDAESPVWSETHPPMDAGSCTGDGAPDGCVEVADGVFHVGLGTQKGLDAGLVTENEELWLGISVEGEPELPRRPLGSVAWALAARESQSAAMAKDLSCSGCVAATELATDSVTPDALAGSVTDQLDDTFVNESGDTVEGDLEVTGGLQVAGGLQVQSDLEAQAGLQVGGGLQAQGTVKATDGVDFASSGTSGFRFENASEPPVACDQAHSGYAYFDPSTERLRICNGETYRGLALLGPGEAPESAASSCKAILEAEPGSSDGTYWIDLDGDGGENPKQRLCDMSGGGWTRIVYDDFEDGSAPGWSIDQVTSCGSLGNILGGHNVISGGSFHKSVDLTGIDHDEVRFTLDYMAIDSWDGESAYVKLDGETAWSTTSDFDNHATDYCGRDNYRGRVYEADGNIAHSGSSVTIEPGSTLDQEPDDEAFGVDDVELWFR